MAVEETSGGSSSAPGFPTRAAGKIGFGCLVLFLLPFCLVGVRAGIGAVAAAVRGDWGDAAFQLVFTVMFGGAGFGTLWAVVRGRGALRRALERHRELPGAAVPGGDDRARLEVPVPAADTSPWALDRDETEDRDEREYRQPAASRIYVETSRRGTAVTFPAARNLGAAVRLLVFLATWVAFTWVLFSFDLDVPDAFRWIVVLVDALVVYLVLRVLFGSSHVEAGPEGITISHRTFGLGITRHLPARELSAVEASEAWRSGSTVYYNVRAVSVDGSRVTLGRSLRDKGEAHWIAGEIWTAVGSKK